MWGKCITYMARVVDERRNRAESRHERKRSGERKTGGVVALPGRDTCVGGYRALRTVR